MRQTPSGPFAIACDSHSLKSPATDTSTAAGAVRLNITDFFAGERMRFGGRSDGLESAPRVFPCDLVGRESVDVRFGFWVQVDLPGDLPDAGRREAGLEDVVRFEDGPRLGVLLLIGLLAVAKLHLPLANRQRNTSAYP